MAPPQDTILTRPMLHHYDVDEVGPLHYIFTTIDGSIYDLSFINVGEYGSLPVYAFNIDRKEAEHCNGSDNNKDSILASLIKKYFEDYLQLMNEL